MTDTATEKKKKPPVTSWRQIDKADDNLTIREETKSTFTPVTLVEIEGETPAKKRAYVNVYRGSYGGIPVEIAAGEDIGLCIRAFGINRKNRRANEEALQRRIKFDPAAPVKHDAEKNKKLI